jgi:hypothetical protein
MRILAAIREVAGLPAPQAGAPAAQRITAAKTAS